MHAEETVAIEALFELSERHGGEVAVVVGLQVRVIVARHDETNAVDRDENLLAALFDRNALRLAGLHMQRDVFARAVHSLLQAIGFDGLHQIIDGIHLEALERVLAVGGNENDRRRIFQTLQGLGELNAIDLGHAHIEEQHVHGIALHFLNSLAYARGLGKHFDPTDFAQQVTQLGTSRSFVVNDNRVQHSIPQ